MRWLLRYALFNPTPLKSGWVGYDGGNLGNRRRGKMVAGVGVAPTKAEVMSLA